MRTLAGEGRLRRAVPSPSAGRIYDLLTTESKFAQGLGHWDNGVFKHLVKCNTIGNELEYPKEHFNDKKENHHNEKPDTRPNRI